MLKVVHPSTHTQEREYALRVVLRDWLGLEYVTERGDADSVQITRVEDPARGKLQVSDVFLATREDQWLAKASLPTEVRPWAPSLDGVPSPLALLFGDKLDNDDYLMVEPGLVRLGVDVFGTAFFMLSRYEEVVNGERDEFGRFAGRFSVLHSAGLVARPIVNEHVELLWWALHRLWPDLVRRPRTYRCLLSCDVDNISVMGVSPWRALRIVVGRSVRDALREGPWYGTPHRAWQLWQAWRGHAGVDDLDDFDFLMEQAEHVGCRMTFNVIAGHGRSGRDGVYHVGSGAIRKLMRRIHDRGHEIGFHGSYDTFLDPRRLRQEFTRLKRIAAEEGVTQAQWGGRQHYLRWAAPTTWQAYEDAGLAVDSSLGYADHAGFRCGTCYEFPAFNLLTREALKLRERPLIVMEGSLFKSAYMGLTSPQAVEKVAALSQACREFGGEFTLLWHNGQTQDPEMRETFLQMLQLAAATGAIHAGAGA